MKRLFKILFYSILITLIITVILWLFLSACFKTFNFNLWNEIAKNVFFTISGIMFIVSLIASWQIFGEKENDKNL